ncbi:hypothetical protein S245_066124, partial [Arachis hypogaea]
VLVEQKSSTRVIILNGTRQLNALSFYMNGDSSHALRIFDEEAQAMQSVRNSRLELQNSTALVETILSSIHGQRERLK